LFVNYSSKIFKDGYELCPGVKVIASAGHTPEDVTVFVDTTKDQKKTRFAITGIFVQLLESIFTDISLVNYKYISIDRKISE